MQEAQELVHEVKLLTHRVGEMQGAVRDMARAMTTLALVEERQVQDRSAMGRAFTRIDSLSQKIDDLDAHLDERVKPLEIRGSLSHQTSQWVLSAVWCGAGLAVALVLRKIGVL